MVAAFFQPNLSLAQGRKAQMQLTALYGSDSSAFKVKREMALPI